MQFGRCARRLLAMAGVVVLVWLGSAPSASAAPASARRHDTGSASTFMGSINAERSSRGLAGLTMHDPIAGTSCTWNHQMRDSQTLAHDPGLVGDADQAAPSWQRVGENVGVGFDISELHAAFMNSPGHRKNILDGEYTHIGICVDSSNDGRFWTTHRFLQLGAVPAPPPPTTAAPPPPTTELPATTVPPTTAAPPTTAPAASTSSSTTVSADPPVEASAGPDATETAAEPIDRDDPANPAVVGAFVAVAFALAGATFFVGRRRRP